jgi:hypothetical protein
MLAVLTTRRPVGGLGEPVQQQARQQERGEMVDLEGHLVAVRARLAAGERTARVVGQHIDPRIAVQQLLSEPADVVETTVVR